MGSREFRIKPDSGIPECPACGQNEEFVAYSQQCQEDLCEVWVTCICGNNPFAENGLHKVEDVMGTLGKPNILLALDEYQALLRGEGERRE